MKRGKRAQIAVISSRRKLVMMSKTTTTTIKSPYKINIKWTARPVTKLSLGIMFVKLLQAHEKFSTRVSLRSSFSPLTCTCFHSVIPGWCLHLNVKSIRCKTEGKRQMTLGQFPCNTFVVMFVINKVRKTRLLLVLTSANVKIIMAVTGKRACMNWGRSAFYHYNTWHLCNVTIELNTNESSLRAK